MEPRVENMLSEKNKILFVIDGFKFYFQKLLCNDIERWACCKRSCKAYIKLNSEHKIILHKINHNHDKNDKQKLNRQQVCNNLKGTTIDDPFEKPSKILHRELLKGDISTWTKNDTTRFRKNFHYARSSIYPKLPDTLIDLHTALDNLNIKTNEILF
ncbi:hypothetical protein QTP88_021499 [Uroleucon formosanum]